MAKGPDKTGQLIEALGMEDVGRVRGYSIQLRNSDYLTNAHNKDGHTSQAIHRSLSGKGLWVPRDGVRQQNQDLGYVRTINIFECVVQHVLQPLLCECPSACVCKMIDSLKYLRLVTHLQANHRGGLSIGERDHTNLDMFVSNIEGGD